MSKKTNPIIAIESESVTIQAADDEHKTPSFEVVAYTGGALKVNGYKEPIVVDLEGLNYRKSLVANLDHDQSKRVGHVSNKSKDGGQLVLAGTASAATAARDEVVRSAADGFVWQASIEAMPRKMETVPRGKTVTVNNQQFTGPLLVARYSTLRGFAFVSHGADDDTVVSISASAGSTKMNAEQKKWIEAQGFDPETLSEEQAESLLAMMPDDTTKTKVVDANLQDVLAKSKAEQARKSRIAEITAQALGDHPQHTESIETLAVLATDGGWEQDKYELELLRACRGGGSGVFRTKPKKRNDVNVLEAALCQAGGLDNLDEKFDEQTIDAADKQFRNGLGLQDILLISARENGYQGLSVNQGSLREIMGAAFQPVNAAAGGFSTFSLPGILSNVMNKFLAEGFMHVDRAWNSIASRRSARDFKAMSTYSLTGDFTYLQMAGDAEIKHGKVGETPYTNKVDTYARMNSITREDLINDDLGALTAVPRRLGRGAALAINDIFWTSFLNNSAFFSVGNGNYQDGAGTALSATSLNDAEVLFMAQTDPDGKPVGIMPSTLLVPNGLYNTALELMNSTLVVTGADGTRPDANVFRGRYNVVTTPYLSNSTIAGSSALAWYLLASASEMPVIEIAFLDGRDMPIVETADADFNVLGIQARGYHDFGVALQEYRGGVKSKGEA